MLGLASLCHILGKYTTDHEGNAGMVCIGGTFVKQSGTKLGDAKIVPIDDPRATSEVQTYKYLLASARCAAHIHMDMGGFAVSPVVTGTGEELYQQIVEKWGGERIIKIVNHPGDAVMVVGDSGEEVLAIIEALKGERTFHHAISISQTPPPS